MLRVDNMISYIKGELAEISEDGVILEAGGMGYEIRMSLSSLSELPKVGSIIKVHTYMHVREDGVSLFGFLTRDNLKVFKLLITVNGIGPKGAMGILSAITPDDLRFAILSEDAKTIAKAPGIGSKTASKLILELKDKFKLEDAFEDRLANNMDSADITPINVAGDIRKEAVEALVVLGYTGTDAAKAVRNVKVTEGMTSEELLKLSLKSLM